MSSSSRVRLTRLRENNGYAQAPTAAAMLVVRRTGGSFSDEGTTEQSAEVRSDLQVTDVFALDYSAKGQIEDEWVYGAHDDELEDAFASAFTTPVNFTDTDISASATDDSYNRVTGDFTADGIVVGGVYDWGSAWTNAGNRGRSRVLTVSATKVTVDKNLTTESAPASVTVTNGGHLRLGTTNWSVLFEELYADISSTEFQQYVGMECTGFTLQWDHPGKITCTFTYEGSHGGYTATTAGNGTVTPYTVRRVMNSSNHVQAFVEGGTAYATGSTRTLLVKSFSLNVSAPKQRIQASGTPGNVDMGLSTFAITGSVSFYNNAAARAIQTKALAKTPTTWSWEFSDPSGNVQHWYLPALVYDSSGPVAGPKDQQVMITLPFKCYQDATMGNTVQMTRFPAA